MSEWTNYFATREVAERYARSRPDAHPQALELVRDWLQLAPPLELGIDVGCGTGLSTTALLRLCRRVIGFDASEGMLAQAPPTEGISWQRAAAEALPLGDNTVDLLTACNAMHWFDRLRFLREAARVLRPGAPLVIYEVSFQIALRRPDDSAPNPEFTHWFRERYLNAFPPPPRRPVSFAAEDPTTPGMIFVGRRDWSTPLRFSHTRFVEYLTSQSNVIAAQERGRDLEEVRQWLHVETLPFFARDGEPISDALASFGGPIWALRKSS